MRTYPRIYTEIIREHFAKYRQMIFLSGEAWTDLGYGEFTLNYLRDKRKREVDFIVSKDLAPWFLVEVKKGEEKLSGALSVFQQMTGARHAIQVVLDGAFVNRNCFDYTAPTVVPARTFLSQLV